jgi:hypothetical protein
MAGPPCRLAIRELLEGQPSLTFSLGGITDPTVQNKTTERDYNEIQNLRSGVSYRSVCLRTPRRDIG